MTSTVILPYNPIRTTEHDIEAISTCLHRRDKTVRLLSFDNQITPVALAEAFPGKTITVTLNNDRPSPIFEFIPGRKFFGSGRSKSQLVKDLVDAGLNVPHSEAFHPNAPIDEAKFGPYTTIKTTAPNTSRAIGIYVFKTADFEALSDELLTLFKRDIDAGYRPILQQYIFTGPRPTHTRVSTFLGAPIVCFQTTAPTEFDPSKMSGLAGGEATSNSSENRSRTLCFDAEMLSVTESVCSTLPNVSVLSVDMVRCFETDKVYCIEANLGNLCVLSAPICGGLRKDLGEEAIHTQFGAYETIARRMIETLRQE